MKVERPPLEGECVGERTGRVWSCLAEEWWSWKFMVVISRIFVHRIPGKTTRPRSRWKVATRAGKSGIKSWNYVHTLLVLPGLCGRSNGVIWLGGCRDIAPSGRGLGPPPLVTWPSRPPPLEKMKLTKVLELHLHCFAELPTCVKKSIGGGVSPYKWINRKIQQPPRSVYSYY